MPNEMIPDDIMEMLPEFLQESEEHLQVLNEKMLDAEKAVKEGATMSQENLNTMFRSAHTIKGTASFIGLKKVVGLTHKAETLLQKLRDGELSLEAKIIDALFSAFDTLTNLLASLKEHKTEGVEIDTDVQKIEMILNPGAPAAAPATPVTPVTPVTPPVAAVPVAPAPVPRAVPAPLPVKSAVSAVSAKKEDADIEPVNEKYLEQFVSEVDSNIEELNNLFLKAEQESQNIQVVHEIFRLMHTIKGSAGLVNAKPIADVAHKVESILHFFRSENKPIPSELLPSFFRGLDALKAMVDSLKKTRAINYDILPICKELDKCSIKVVLEMKVGAKHPGGDTGAKPQAVKIQEVVLDWAKELTSSQKALIKTQIQQGQDLFLIEAVIAAREAMKTMRLVMIEERLNKNGRMILAVPSGDALDAVKMDAMVGALFCSSVNESNIREILSMDGVAIKTVVKTDNEFVTSILGEKVMEQATPDAFETQPVHTAAVVSAATASVVEAAKPASGATAAGGVAASTPIEISTIKIDSRKLDKLMNLSGELVIVRSQYARLVGLLNNDLIRQKEMMRMTEHAAVLLEDLNKEFVHVSSGGSKEITRVQKMIDGLKVSLHTLCDQVNHEEIVDNIHTLSETTGALEKIASDLQASVMQTRMVPVEGIFTRFKRIVRDISKDLNKDVVLQIEGAETELDKKIVDGLGDPLTHMIRNAVDHGLENKEDREKTGKPSVGTILLRASHKGNSMCIEITDDGKGMDAEKIAGIAVKKGVITDEQATRMTEKEKLNLIFLPGFSTAQKVTGLSGRGVGMDVVRSMIASFNGVVDITTRVGEGSTFILKFPLTLAIIQSLLVVIGGDVFAFPLDAVTEIIKVPAKDIYSIDGNATVKLRDHALSLIELSNVIQVKPNVVTDKQDKRVIIITDGENRLGVMVDSLVGKDEIVIKSFTKHFSRVKGVIGASILADGNVALILDPATIIKESR